MSEMNEKRMTGSINVADETCKLYDKMLKQKLKFIDDLKQQREILNYCCGINEKIYNKIDDKIKEMLNDTASLDCSKIDKFYIANLEKLDDEINELNTGNQKHYEVLNITIYKLYKELELKNEILDTLRENLDCDVEIHYEIKETLLEIINGDLDGREYFY
tara:strand:- start:13447 stop:13929 length:483 start_codon:yes stop_codon:yes gene_type:complete